MDWTLSRNNNCPRHWVLTSILTVCVLGFCAPLAAQRAGARLEPDTPAMFARDFAPEFTGLPGADAPLVLAGPQQNRTILAGFDAVSRSELWRRQLDTIKVYSLFPAGDGKCLILVGADPTKKNPYRHPDQVVLWNAVEGKELAHLLVPEGVYEVTAAASRDLKRLLALENGERLRLWDTTTDKEIRSYTPGRYLSAIALSADGHEALLGGRHLDEDVQLVNLALNEVRKTFHGHTGELTCVAYSPDQKRFMSAASDCTIRLWDIGTGRCIRRLKADSPAICSRAVFSPDGLLVAAIESAPTNAAVSTRAGDHVRVWNLTSGHCSAPIALSGRTLSSVAFAPDGSAVIVAGAAMVARFPVPDDLRGGDAGILNTAIAQEPPTSQIQCLEVPEPTCVRFAGKTLLCGGRGNSVSRWEVGTWRSLGQQVPTQLQQWPEVHAFSADGRYALSCSFGHVGNEAWLWEIDSGLECWKQYWRGEISAVALNGDGMYSAVAYRKKDEQYRLVNNDITIIGRLDKKEVAGTDAGDTSAIAVQFSPDGSKLAIGGHGRPAGGGVRIWDLKNGQETAIPAQCAIADGVSFSADGRRILCADMTSLTLCDLATAKAIASIPMGDGVTAATIAPDGRYALIGRANSNVEFWDLEQCRRLAVFEEHRNRVAGVVFSADGTLGASCAADDTVRVWKLPLPEGKN